MTSKWCSDCEKINSAVGGVNYCGWCGKDLRAEAILPEFKTWEARCALIKELQSITLPAINKQLKLF